MAPISRRWLRASVPVPSENFQVLRRTHASLSRKANVDDKVSADQRGHGLGGSLGVYAMSDLEQKIDAVTKLESDVLTDSEAFE